MNEICHRIVLLLALGTGSAPAENNNFANATELSDVPLPYTKFFGANSTAEPGEPAHAGSPAANSIWFQFKVPQTGTYGFREYFNTAPGDENSIPIYPPLSTVWWRWTAPASGFYRVSARGSDVIPTVNIYTGVPAALTMVTGLQLEEGVRFSAAAGTLYWIQLNSPKERDPTRSRTCQLAAAHSPDFKCMIRIWNCRNPPLSRADPSAVDGTNLLPRPPIRLGQA